MPENNILAFDSIFSTNTLQLLKVILPLFPVQIQAGIALFIKFQEFQYTYQYLSNHPTASLCPETSMTLEEKITKTIKDIRPYCPAEYITYIEQFESILNISQKYKEIEPFIKCMGNENGDSPFQLLFGNEASDSISKYENMINDLF